MDCGLLWCFYQFSFWRHPFTAEDPVVKQMMWCHISPNLFRGRNKLMYILDDLRVSTFSSKFASLVNYSFKMLSMWAAHYVFEQSFAVKKRTKGFSHRSGKSFELRLPNWLSKQLTCMFNIGTHMQFSLCFMLICFFPFDSSSVSLFSVLFLINRIWSIISLSPHSMMWMRKDPQWYRTTWLDIKKKRNSDMFPPCLTDQH